MKCAVVQDLLPNYCDGLCSPETALEIEKHTAECPVCSSLLKDYKSELKPEKEIKNSPEKPFKKLKKKLSRHKFLAISLALCLLVFVGWEGFLMHANSRYDSLSSVYYTREVKKVMESICSGDADSAVKMLDIDNGVLIKAAMLKTGTDTDILDPCREHCKNMINRYYDYIKDKNTEIDLDATHSGGGSYDCRFIVKTEGLPDVFFEIQYSVLGSGFYVYTINCKTEDTNDDFNTFINYELDTSFHPSQYLNSTWEMNYINEQMDIGVSIAADHYSDNIKKNEEYASQLHERFMEIRESGIKCDEFLKENLRLDYENGRFLTDIYAVFTDPDTGNKIVYCRTVQVAGHRYVILDEYQPVIIDGGVSPDVHRMVENLF